MREPRNIWAYEREEFRFSRMLNDERFSDFWSQDFRMKKETFDEIVQVVRPALEKRDTQLRRTIPIQKRVGVAIWRLATRTTFRSIAKTFAIGKSAAAKITKEFCLEIKRKAPHYIKFPKQDWKRLSLLRSSAFQQIARYHKLLMELTYVSALSKQMENQIILVANSAILCDCNWTRTQNHLVLKRTLNHLPKLA